MRPKEFQENALDTFAAFLAELKKQKDEADNRAALHEQGKITLSESDRDYFARTWAELGRRGLLPRVAAKDGSVQLPAYARREDCHGSVVPHVCLKLPTGGGKTLLGVAALERMKPQAGLVLWVTPSRAIYKQTVRAFAHRAHPYRQWLERACGGRVKLLRKKDHFSRADVENYLCVLPIMLQAADRRNDTGFLKIFRDTGKYPGFFPDADDAPANDELLAKHPDLHTGDLAEDAPGAVKHSLFNALKIARPIIVLDEAHNAYTENRRRRLCEFNPRFVLELSATPELGVSNVLVDVPGAALKREQMIKLPLHVHNFEKTDWKYTLSKAKERLDRLEQEAKALYGEGGRYIRPIMLIRVERVGREQRDGHRVHAEDVRDYLMTQLKVPQDHIRRKTAERDEIADENLLSPYSAVRYILTKDALREGWDCPFAYVLALLDTTNAPRALTQMTGRILRQPGAELTGRTALDESYIYCFDRNVGETVAQVKRGLEQEGMSDLAEFVRQGDAAGGIPGGAGGAVVKKIQRRRAFKDTRIFLPRVLHRVAKGGKRYRPLNYETDVLGGVNWNDVAAAPLGIDVAAIDKVREIRASVNLPGFDFDSDKEERAIVVDKELTVEFFTRRVYEILPNPWLAGQVVRRMFDSLRGQYKDNDAIFDRRYHLSEILKQRLAELIEHGAQQVFARKLESGDVRFELIADDDFELGPTLEKMVASGQPPLFREHGDALEKSLYETMYTHEFNGLETDFALYLDGHSAVAWWHRFAARQDYGLQGWKQHRVYPDFVVCVGKANGNGNKRRVLVLETKGMQLAGNLDTEYKETLFKMLETAEPRTAEYGSLALAKDNRKKHRMAMRMMFEDNYREDFERLVQS